MKTAELSGAALDWAVAKAEGLEVKIEPPIYGTGPRVFASNGLALTRYRPSTDWAQGGPLIQKYGVLLSPPASQVHRNYGYADARNGYYESGLWGTTIFGRERKHRRTSFSHPTEPLIAGMRAIVQFELGDEVQVPDGLAQAPLSQC